MFTRAGIFGAQMPGRVLLRHTVITFQCPVRRFFFKFWDKNSFFFNLVFQDKKCLSLGCTNAQMAGRVLLRHTVIAFQISVQRESFFNFWDENSFLSFSCFETRKRIFIDCLSFWDEGKNFLSILCFEVYMRDTKCFHNIEIKLIFIRYGLNLDGYIMNQSKHFKQDQEFHF